MKSLMVIVLFGFCPLPALAQLAEDFSDGDLSSNPPWTYNSNEWITNSNMQLQSNHSFANSSFYISTPQTLSGGVQWEFFVRLSFNPSSANYVDVFLISNLNDLASASNLGYFVRIGNTQDEISLYRKDAGGIVKIIDGTDGIFNSSENIVRIKVARTAQNVFILDRDVSGSGSQYTSEGSVTDSQYLASSFFGILVRQSTSSFFNKHFFDDIVISNYIPDTLPPDVVSVQATSQHTIEIKFNEAPAQPGSLTAINYFADQGIGNPFQLHHIDARTVSLTFTQNFLSGTTYQIHIQNIRDNSGNQMNPSDFPFEYYTAGRNDIILYEIMADPGPPVGLPNAEFIELRNRSGKEINLQGWKLVISGTETGELPAIILKPDSLLIIAANASINFFQIHGSTAGVASFPTLANSSGIISLISKEGKIIHAIEYSDQWYDNALKKEGGWSLEMIDAGNPCGAKNNWKASEHSSGGTPGKINSVNGNNPDTSPPELLRSYSTDSTYLVAVFNEPLDSSSAVALINFQMSAGLQADSAIAIPPLFNEVQLKLHFPMEKKKVYKLNSTGLKDCMNNISSIKEVKAGSFSDPGYRDVVVNEVLFDPRPNGFDYVEFLNRSDKVLDLSQLYLANRNSTGTPASITRLVHRPYALFPGDHAVFSESRDAISIQYHLKFPEQCFELGLPSYPDDSGNVLLLDAQGKSIDEVNYSEKWHFALLKDKEGVALERIDSEDSTNSKHNWQSAAYSAGFGTPGYANSQHRVMDMAGANIEVIPKSFSPDMDGYDDFMMLHYQVDETGFMMNSTVYDAGGRPVRMLVKNSLLGRKGSFKWDGLDDSNLRLRPGTYIIYTEIFNLQAKKISFKNVVVIGRVGSF